MANNVMWLEFPILKIIEETSLSENDESPSQFVATPNRHRVEYQKAMPNSVTSAAGFNVCRH